MVDSEIERDLPEIDQIVCEFQESINSPESKQVLDANSPVSKQETEQDMNNQVTNQEGYQDPNDSFVSTGSKIETQHKKGMRFVMVVFRKIWLNFLMIWLNYTICFLVFPGVTMMKT